MSRSRIRRRHRGPSCAHQTWAQVFCRVFVSSLDPIHTCVARRYLLSSHWFPSQPTADDFQSRPSSRPWEFSIFAVVVVAAVHVSGHFVPRIVYAWFGHCVQELRHLVRVVVVVPFCSEGGIDVSVLVKLLLDPCFWCLQLSLCPHLVLVQLFWFLCCRQSWSPVSLEWYVVVYPCCEVRCPSFGQSGFRFWPRLEQPML